MTSATGGPSSKSLSMNMFRRKLHSTDPAVRTYVAKRAKKGHTLGRSMPRGKYVTQGGPSTEGSFLKLSMRLSFFSQRDMIHDVSSLSLCGRSDIFRCSTCA